MSSNRLEIPLSLVIQLIREQFPQWAHLEITPVKVSGWDNKTFHLGEEMSIRLPTAERYASQVSKEYKWLPILAKHLSFPIPKPIAMGKPSINYPFNWSINEWIEGKSANNQHLQDKDLEKIALSLTQFLQQLHKIDIQNAPLSGPDNFYRGGSLSVYDTETKAALNKLQNIIDHKTALSVWNKARASQWTIEPVWIHGDLAAGNILIKDNKLHAIIDFGQTAVGDPACDLTIAWTFFKGKSRDIFKSNINLDPNTWACARGWALWKALITFISLENNSEEAKRQKQIINDICIEYNS